MIGPPLAEPPLARLAAGFALWAALSALGLAASWTLAAALLPGRGTLARLQAALLIGIAIALTAVQGLGALGLLRRAPLALAGLALFSGAGLSGMRLRARRAAAGDPPSPVEPGLGKLLLGDLRAPALLAREALREREPLALALLACAIPYLAQALIIYCFRSWTWDPVWYHTPITDAAITGHGLGFLGSHDVRAEGFVRNLELLSVWNVLLPRDTLLDDAAQLPFCALAFLSLAAWARQLGAGRALAAGLGGAFLLAPPVFLQAGSTHVDIACAALLLTAFQQWTGPRLGRSERLLGFTALALYAGTKFTGLFHAALLAPLFAGRLLLAERARRRAGDREASGGAQAGGGGRVAGAGRVGLAREAAALAALAFWLGGGLIYLHNLRLHGNPLWPVEARLFGLQLPGAVDASQEWTRPFLFSPGAVPMLLRSWFELPREIWPDVRGGGFGPLFRWLTLPCCALAALLLLARRTRARAAAALGLLLLALSVPDAWWPRFTLCAGAAALGAFLLVRERLPRPWLQRGLSLVALGLACAGVAEGWPGLASPLGKLRASLGLPHLARALVQPVHWVWTEEMCRLRERDLGEGEAVAFDDSVFFLGDFWTYDLRSRVVYLQHPADGEAKTAAPGPEVDAAWLLRLRSEGAVWAAVRPGGNAERALRAAGSRFLFHTPVYASAVYRTPFAGRPAAVGPAQ